MNLNSVRAHLDEKLASPHDLVLGYSGLGFRA